MYFLRLLRHSRQPAERQQTFLRELGGILRAHTEKAFLPSLPVPRFLCRSIRVLLNDHNQPSGTQVCLRACLSHPYHLAFDARHGSLTLHLLLGWDDVRSPTPSAGPWSTLGGASPMEAPVRTSPSSNRSQRG